MGWTMSYTAPVMWSPRRDQPPEFGAAGVGAARNGRAVLCRGIREFVL